MQSRPIPPKQKYKIKDFSVGGTYATNKSTFFPNDNSCKLYCLCNEFHLKNSRKCYRCGQSYHACVAGKGEAGPQWQCLHCESKFMDPIYWPEEVLLETFFKTESVLQFGNVFEFGFFLTPEQVKKPVEVRGLQDGRTGLAWPMHGEFFFNKQQFPEPIVDLKPLLKNSNRKFRKEQAMMLPQNQLKVGRNILTFSIPKLNPAAYEAKYQIEVRAIYFIGIYSIKKYTKEDLVQKTFKTSRIQKEASLQFLRTELLGGGQLSVQKSIISLQCPYQKSRIKTPIRGRKCQHYTCICLQTLIQSRVGMNSREWLCPICNAPINEPMVDMFIASILNDGSAGIKVALEPSGKYQWIGFEEEAECLSSDQESVKVGRKLEEKGKGKEQIEIEEPVERMEVVVKPKVPEVPKARMASQKPVETVIDLEDEQIPPVSTPAVIPQPQPQPRPKPLSIPPIIPPFQPPPPPVSLPLPQPQPQPQPSQKLKQLQQIKQKLKQDLKQRKRKQAQDPHKFTPMPPKKDDLLITDVKELEFKAITFGEFSRRYFRIDYNRGGLGEEIRAIFKDVL